LKKKREELTKTLLPTGALLGELKVMELVIKFPVDKVKKLLICVERYPTVPKPMTVEPSCVWRYDVDTSVAKLAVETRFAKFAVETRFAKFAVETRRAKFAVLTRPNPPMFVSALERYPTVPRPITVLVRFACVRKLTPTIGLVDMIGA
jgi:hypothetical protein